MIDFLKKIINDILIGVLKNTKGNKAKNDLNKNLFKSKFELNKSSKKLLELEIAKQKAREVQSQYKKNFSNIEEKKQIRRDFEEKIISQKKIEKEKALQLESERYQEKILLEVKRTKEEKERLLQEEMEKMLQIILKIYEENPDGSLKIDDYKDFLKIIEINQDVISQFDHKYIRDFVRLSALLESKAGLIQKHFASLRKLTGDDRINSLKNINLQLQSEINLYKKTFALSLAMFTALISKDLVAFYKMYEQFDLNGLFDSRHEKIVQESLSNINKNFQNIAEKMEGIDSRIDRVAVAICKMDYMIGDNFDRLDGRIRFELDRVESSISYPRLVENLAPLAPTIGLVGGYQLGYSLTGPPKN